MQDMKKTVLEGGICNSNVECWFLRSEENREKKGHGKIVEVRINLAETVIGRALLLRIPLMFQLRCLTKLKRDIHRCEGEGKLRKQFVG